MKLSKRNTKLRTFVVQFSSSGGVFEPWPIDFDHPMKVNLLGEAGNGLKMVEGV